MIKKGKITRAEQRKIKRKRGSIKADATARKQAEIAAEFEKWVKLIGWPAPEKM